MERTVKPMMLAPVLFLALASPLCAGDVYHPDSNAATGGTLGLPWGGAEVRYQAHVPASVFGGKSFRIADLAFAPGATGPFTSTRCEIRMAHTTSNSISVTFASNLQKDLTVVFSGKISWPGTRDQWSNVGLTSFFSYNGVDNLVVEIRHMGSAAGLVCRTGRVNIRYVSGPGSYNAATGGLLTPLMAPKMRFTCHETVVNGSGSTNPGGTVELDLLSSNEGNLPYQLGSSLSNGPIPIDTRLLSLGIDDMLVISVNGWVPQIFEKYAGFLDASGKAKARIHVPNLSVLKGVRIYTAFVVVKAGSPSNIAQISNTFMFTIT